MNESTLVIPAKFNRDRDGWEFVYHSEQNIQMDRLIFLTFNTWFSDFHFEERFKAILKILKGSNADIIALQEITDRSLQLILQEDWVKNHYYISDFSGSTFYSYGVIFLSKMPINLLYLYPLPSIMGRNVLIAEFVVNKQKILIGTTHLESYPISATIRSSQLKEIFQLLNDSNHSVLMGDFNFCSSWVENSTIDNRYLDFWEILRPDEPGHTEDTDINTMRKNIKQKDKFVRFDRILIRSTDNMWKPKTINRIGKKPISPEFPDIFPSDHFGLVGTIEWTKR